MPLTSIEFFYVVFGSKLTDKGLEHLKGMPLTSVDFTGCHKFTNQALEHLKGMPLTSVASPDATNLRTRLSNI